jgi:hypothetical protein
MEIMPRSFVSSTATNHGPTFIGTGLAVVLAAHVFAGVPIAAAIALIAWGSMLTLKARQQHEVLIALNLATYLSIVALAMLAEFDSRTDIWLLMDVSLASAFSLTSIICLLDRPLS